VYTSGNKKDKKEDLFHFTSFI